MLSLILKILGGSKIALGLLLGGAALVASMSVSFWWQKRGLNHTIEKQAATIAAKDGEIRAVRDYSTKLETEVAGQNLKSEQCKAEVQRVRDEVAAIQVKANRADAKAASAALQAELEGQKLAEALRSGHTHVEPTDAAVNQRLREMFP